jgi:predicted DCC family thiol-disulfide oxidoreductase YuxK
MGGQILNTVQYKIFLDGICHVCAEEAKFLRRNDPQKLIGFIDISAPDFNPDQFGVSVKRVNTYLHVVGSDGVMYTGLPAIIRVWNVLPKYRWVAKVLSAPGIRQLATIGYLVFAHIRPLLPKRKTSIVCDLEADL